MPHKFSTQSYGLLSKFCLALDFYVQHVCLLVVVEPEDKEETRDVDHTLF